MNELAKKLFPVTIPKKQGKLENIRYLCYVYIKEYI